MDIKKTLILDSADPVSKAASHLREAPAVIVTREGRYQGLIDHASMDKGLRNPAGMKCETLLIKPPIIKTTSDIVERIDSFLVGHFKALPVVDEDQAPLGITTRVELLSDLMKLKLVPKSGIDQMMSSPVFMIDEQETVAKAKALLKERKARRLVVVNSAGSPIGVVSNFDLSFWSGLARASSGRKDTGITTKDRVDQIQVSGFLRPDMTTIAHERTVEDAVKKMIKNQVSHVIVISQRKPVGVLSAVDVFRSIKEMGQESLSVSISGLKGDNRIEYETIRERVLRALDRFGKSFAFRNVQVHVKEEKSNFILNLYLETGKERITLKEERPTIKEALDRVIVDLGVLLSKRKEKRRLKPRTCKSGSKVRR